MIPLGFDFLATALVIIYVGAVVIFFIFILLSCNLNKPDNRHIQASEQQPKGLSEIGRKSQVGSIVSGHAKAPAFSITRFLRRTWSWTIVTTTYEYNSGDTPKSNTTWSDQTLSEIPLSVALTDKVSRPPMQVDMVQATFEGATSATKSSDLISVLVHAVNDKDISRITDKSSDGWASTKLMPTNDLIPDEITTLNSYCSPELNNITALGQVIYNQYWSHLYLTALLLLVAMIGADVLFRKHPRI